MNEEPRVSKVRKVLRVANPDNSGDSDEADYNRLRANGYASFTRYQPQRPQPNLPYQPRSAASHAVFAPVDPPAPSSSSSSSYLQQSFPPNQLPNSPDSIGSYLPDDATHPYTSPQPQSSLDPSPPIHVPDYATKSLPTPETTPVPDRILPLHDPPQPTNLVRKPGLISGPKVPIGSRPLRPPDRRGPRTVGPFAPPQRSLGLSLCTKSPTAQIQDPQPSPSAHSPSTSSSTPATEKIVFVTADRERYTMVDITHAKSGAQIREAIFSKGKFSTEKEWTIYKIEIDAPTHSEVLHDDHLFQLCRSHADSKGTLKFLVLPTRTPIAERPPPPPPVSVSDPLLPMRPPPPVVNITPLRPYKRRSRSRNGSFSSVHEIHETTQQDGYDADLDNPDREGNKGSRPAQHQPSTSAPVPIPHPPPSPRRHPSMHQPRPSSPLVPPADFPGSAPQASERSWARVEKLNPSYPTPLSPNHSSVSFPEEPLSLSVPSNRTLHTRTASDAGTDREAAQRFTEHDYIDRRPRDISGPAKLSSTQPLRAVHRVLPDEDTWEFVQSEPARSPEEPEPPRSQVPKPRPSRISPVARFRPHSPFTSRSGSSSSVAAQAANASDTPRSRPAARQPLPPNFFALWKAEPGPRKPSLSKYKSMDNLNQVSPNSPRARAQLPINPPISSPPSQMPYSPNNLNMNMPAVSRSGFVRPLPSHNPSEYSSTPSHRGHYGNVTGSSGDPLSKPTVEPMTSPTRGYSRLQSPVYGPNLDTGEPTRSPRAVSPIRPYHTPGIPGPRPRPPNYSDRSDRSSDIQSGPETSNTTPPRTPVSPHPSSPQDGSDGKKNNGPLIEPPSPLSTENPITAVPGHHRPTELTIRQDERMQLAKIVGDLSDTGGGTVVTTERRKSRRGDKASSALSDSTSTGTYPGYASDSSTDSMGGGGTWLVRPDPPKMSRPPLKVQIENGTSSTTSVNSKPINSNNNSNGHGTIIGGHHSSSSSVGGGSNSTGTSSGSRTLVESGRSSSSTMLGGHQSSTLVASSSSYRGDNNSAPPPTRPPPPASLMPAFGKNHVLDSRPPSAYPEHDDTWILRPPAENIYDRLEDFFSKQVLDKAVIENTSGDTSPTEPVAPIPVPPIPTQQQPPPVSHPVSVVGAAGGLSTASGLVGEVGGRVRAKKSIRVVAEEHKKRIDRMSRADHGSYSDNMLRKRNTKLWGMKGVRVDEAQENQLSLHNGSSARTTGSSPDSPSGQPTSFKWVRGELLGKGTYGRVYLALNATTGEMIAVKQVELPQTASDRQDSRQHTVVQALKSESETLKDLDHPNIVQYLGFEETPTNLSIFLEYVPGGSVGSCLARYGKFEDTVTRSFTSQILAGLEYLHSKGILHRDLKADNILVETSGVCKISDFGISKRTEDVHGDAFTALQGTVFWMAPEVINTNKKGYNFKVDIWSVGCVVLEMWAGMRPWTGEEMVAVMFKLYQSKLPPPIPDDIHLCDDALDFRTKCFAINPDERPSAAELRKHPYLLLPPGWVFTGFT